MAGAHAPVAVLRLAEEVERRLGGLHVSDEFPVHQVLGMENGKPGAELKLDAVR